MANHKRRRPKHQRAGCLLCKPHKDERLPKRARSKHAQALLREPVLRLDPDNDPIDWCPLWEYGWVDISYEDDLYDYPDRVFAAQDERYSYLKRRQPLLSKAPQLALARADAAIAQFERG